MDDHNRLIQDGFNAAYLIQKHKPALAETLRRGLRDRAHPFAQGFEAGAFEVEREDHRKDIETFFQRERDRDHTRESDQGYER